MPRRKKLNTPDGKEHWMNEIGFRPEVEHWSTYLVDDGTVLRVKHIVKNVLKAEDLKTSDGDPVYMIEGENSVVASVPDDEKGDQ